MVFFFLYFLFAHGDDGVPRPSRSMSLTLGKVNVIFLDLKYFDNYISVPDKYKLFLDRGVFILIIFASVPSVSALTIFAKFVNCCALGELSDVVLCKHDLRLRLSRLITNQSNSDENVLH